MAHNMSYKASKNIFTRNAVKQKTLNTTDVVFRGGIRL